jgi:hypothetical protein
MTATNCVKIPTVDQLVVGFARLRREFDALKDTHPEMSGLRFPDQAELAENLGISVRTLKRLWRITSEEPTVVRAVAERQLSRKALETLMADERLNADTRAELVGEALDQGVSTITTAYITRTLLPSLSQSGRLKLMPPANEPTLKPVHTPAALAIFLTRALEVYEGLENDERIDPALHVLMASLGARGMREHLASLHQ